MNEAEKVKMLEDAGKIITEEEKKALEILEIDTGIDGHHTAFKFKKALLDKDFIWEITLDLEELPRRVNLYYKLNLVLDPTNYNVALNAQFYELKKNQLSLLDSENNYLKEMERIHREYEKDRNLLGDYTFEARLSELKNKQTETLNFIVSGPVVRKFEELRTQNALHRMTLVLETL